MLKKERQAFILHEVNLHNRVLCTDIIDKLNVSEDTVRRDLQELADADKLIKVHGGALSHSFNDLHFVSQEVYAHPEKKIIARKAAALIQDGMFVLSGGGSTVIEMARALPAQLKAIFITGSIPAVIEYMNHPHSEVIVIGDKVIKNAKLTAGADAISRIRNIKADLCFLGVNALDMQHGITDNDWEVVQVKKAMIESSKKVICLTISEKLNCTQPIQVVGINKIHTLVTELSPGAAVLKPYKKAGIQII